MKDIEFVKAVASGNDFIIIDRFRRQKSVLRLRSGLALSKVEVPEGKAHGSQLAKELCRRKLSVGADGLLIIEPSKKADFKMRIFNPDGSEVDMCGNGSRCLALYAAREGICGKKMLIETPAGNLSAEVKEDKVKIKLSSPKDLKTKFNLNINGKTEEVSYINTGVPHLVCFAQDLDNFNVQETGKAIRYHPEFQPQGTNADFVETLDKDHIRIRTFERGVEEETLACGTGAVAAGIITVYQMQQEPQGAYTIKVTTQGGETLGVYFTIEKDNINEVYLEGRARIVYVGTVYS